jgi:flagellar motor switch protein FliG
MTTATEKLSGPRKVAILLSVLEEDAAASIFRNLDRDDLQRVADEVANLGQVPPEVSLQVIREYQSRSMKQDMSAHGGKDVAKRLLTKALGEEDSEAIMQQMVRANELSPIETLRRADPQKLAKFLEAEHPQTIALILGQLGDRQASALLIALPPEVRAEAVKRLAALRKFSPELTERVSTTLSRRLRAVGEQGKRTYSGFQSVADIMNRIDTSVAQQILENIESEEPSLAVSIRDLMFTFNDLLEVDESQIRELTSAVDKKVLATALKGTSEDLKNLFFKTMSSRAVEMLKEDMDALGPVRTKDAMKAQAEIVALARKLESEGKMMLKKDGGDEYVV